MLEQRTNSTDSNVGTKARYLNAVGDNVVLILRRQHVQQTLLTQAQATESLRSRISATNPT